MKKDILNYCAALEKDFDDTDLETEKYDERVRSIGREFLFTLSNVNN